MCSSWWLWGQYFHPHDIAGNKARRCLHEAGMRLLQNGRQPPAPPSSAPGQPGPLGVPGGVPAQRGSRWAAAGAFAAQDLHFMRFGCMHVWPCKRCLHGQPTPFRIRHQPGNRGRRFGFLCAHCCDSLLSEQCMALLTNMLLQVRTAPWRLLQSISTQCK